MLSDIQTKTDVTLLVTTFYDKVLKDSLLAPFFKQMDFEKHLPQTILFVDQHPNLSMVIDHIAKPRIQLNNFDHTWAKNMQSLAERENVTCKLSGMVTEVINNKWNYAVLKPYFDVILEVFGPDRIMFGSDWPVCLLQSTYNKWVETVATFISPLTISEQSAIMGGTAERIYLNHL